MNIDELALKVASSLEWDLDATEKEDMQTFAREFLKQYEAEDAQPFGYLCDWGNDGYELQRIALYYGEPGSATEDDWNEFPKVHNNLPIFLRPDPRVNELEEQHTKDGVLIFQLDKANRELERQLAEARKDAERLDYLNKVSTTNDGQFEVWAAWEGGHKTLRESIDAALAATKEESLQALSELSERLGGYEPKVES